MSAAKHLACFPAYLKCPHLQTEDNNAPTSSGNYDDERRRDGGGTVQAEAAGPERAGPKQSPPRVRAQLWFLPFDISELRLLISTVDTEPPSSAGNRGTVGQTPAGVCGAGRPRLMRRPSPLRPVSTASVSTV